MSSPRPFDTDVTDRPLGSPRRARGTDPIVLGLVNIMPDAALRATEQQYRELLSEASGGRAIRLRIFSLPQVPRGEAGRAYVALSYEDIAQLWHAELDGLIVTGSEPRARALQDEPFWPGLASLTDWAETHTLSTVWSCLAAQAAALRLDGIARRPFGWKLSGVFPCKKAAEHVLTDGFPPCWRVPQTRFNDLPEQSLTAHGYRILSRLPDAGADMFIKEVRSLFVFLQGHPEYHPRALFLEYRRDVARYLAGERETYPDPMQGYFDARTRAALELFRERSLQTRDAALIDRLPEIFAGWTPTYDWREPAVRLYANWLRCLEERKRGNAGAPAESSQELRAEAVAGG